MLYQYNCFFISNYLFEPSFTSLFICITISLSLQFSSFSVLYAILSFFKNTLFAFQKCLFYIAK